MAVVSVVSSSSKVSGSTSPLTLTAPASIADGDLILIWCHSDESATQADFAITGFTGVFASIKGGATVGASGRLFYKVASGEGASYSVSRTDGSGNWGAIGMRITNTGGNPAIDTYATATSAENEAVTPALTTGADNCLIIRGASWNESKTLNAVPANHTAIQHNDLSSNDGHTIYTTAEIATSGTDVGTASYDLSATTETATFTISIKPPVAADSAALTGTATASITETDVVTGSKTVILTLTGDTWVTTGATFDAQRQNIINGIDSAQAEATGWDAEVKAKEVVGAVVRTSDTVVTITLTAQAGYNITATETITATIPATALTGAAALVASPTFTVSPITSTRNLAALGVG